MLIQSHIDWPDKYKNREREKGNSGQSMTLYAFMRIFSFPLTGCTLTGHLFLFIFLILGQLVVQSC